MKIEDLLKMVDILKYVKNHPNCIAPDIREELGVVHSDPPSQEEKNMYKLITWLVNSGYIEKRMIKKRELGGAHFTLIITVSGTDFLKKLGISADLMDSSEKGKLLEQIESSLRLILRKTFKNQISKPLAIELVPELSNRLMQTLREEFKDINLIKKSESF